jgi:hypothetical protein
MPWVHVPSEVECLGGPSDGREVDVSQARAVAGQVVPVPVGWQRRGTTEDYVLARDDDRLVALYPGAVELDD